MKPIHRADPTCVVTEKTLKLMQECCKLIPSINLKIETEQGETWISADNGGIELRVEERIYKFHFPATVKVQDKIVNCHGPVWVLYTTLSIYNGHDTPPDTDIKEITFTPYGAIDAAHELMSAWIENHLDMVRDNYALNETMEDQAAVKKVTFRREDIYEDDGR